MRYQQLDANIGVVDIFRSVSPFLGAITADGCAVENGFVNDVEALLWKM